jgi:hypothetical protein
MRLSGIDYPLRLCVDMLYFAGLGADGKTEDMKASDITNALSVFFDEGLIKEAKLILLKEG